MHRLLWPLSSSLGELPYSTRMIVIFRVLGDGTENTAIVALGLRLWVFVSNWAFLSICRAF